MKGVLRFIVRSSIAVTVIGLLVLLGLAKFFALSLSLDECTKYASADQVQSLVRSVWQLAALGGGAHAIVLLPLLGVSKLRPDLVAPWPALCTLGVLVLWQAALIVPGLYDASWCGLDTRDFEMSLLFTRFESDLGTWTALACWFVMIFSAPVAVLEPAYCAGARRAGHLAEHDDVAP